MVARYHHLATWFAQFGHDLTLTSGRVIGRREYAERDRSRKKLGTQNLRRKTWNANLGTQNLRCKTWDAKHLERMYA
jgi:hypothetical protein